MRKDSDGMGKMRGWKKRAAATAAVFLLAAVLFSIKVKEIQVTGSEHYEDGQLEAILFPDGLSRNFIYCFFKDHFCPHEKIPFVESYDLHFAWPGRVEVIVYEKSIVGCVSYMSNYMYFDKDGMIVESSNERLKGVPWVTGLKFGQIVLYQKLPVESEGIFQEIMNLTQILSVYGLDVDKIQYSDDMEISLSIGEIDVALGSGEALNGKIAELNDILPTISGRSGTLHLEDYEGEGSAAGYAFRPRSRE